MAELRRAALRIPGLRGVALGSARYHVGTVTEARLGYQVVRILTSHAHRRARARLLQRDRSSLARTLLADGIAVVPNFLDDSEFGTVRTACLRALAMSTEGPL